MTKITNSKKIVDSWSIVEEKHIELVQQTGKILSETANNVLNTASEVWDTVQPQLNTFAKQTQKVLGDAANSAFTTASDSLAPVIGEIGALKNQSTNEFSRLVEESKSELNQFAQNVEHFYLMSLVMFLTK